jgi:ketosteroid isomerase-like protein
LALPQTSPLDSVVETERAFARACVERGVRDSFLAFFADDAVNFWPHPVNAREALLKQPAPPERPTTTLNWEPSLADVSGAGDLGYTTGPSLTTDDKQNPIQSGYYFSIWRRQSDGSWKVELDIGIKTPPTSSLPPPALRTPTQFARGNNRRSAGEDQSVLIDLERNFPASTNVTESFLKLITDDAQLNHYGYFPVVGRKEIRAFLAEKRFTLKWEPIRAVVSSSHDFAYTYGKYTRKEIAQPQAAVKTGYYVHVWRRDAKARWNLAVEVSAAPFTG